MERSELLQTKEYWVTSMQIAIYNCAMQFMAEHNMNRTQLAHLLGVSKGYVTQLLNGDFDHRLSKLVELALAFGYAPEINFIPLQDYVTRDEVKITTTRIGKYAKNSLSLAEKRFWKNEQTWGTPSTDPNIAA